MTKPTNLKHISRAICPKTGIHFLDAVDELGQHYTATMQQKEEPWLTYVQPWILRTH